MDKKRILKVTPGELAETDEILMTLENMQGLVGGLIERIFPFHDCVTLICNDEGKINGMPMNRCLFNEHGKLIEILAGPFFIVGITGDNEYTDLTDEQIERYMRLFKYPDIFLKKEDGTLFAIIPQNHIK